MIARTAEQCFMPLTVGGGVRTHRGHPQAAACRRRQGVDQHRAVARPEFVGEAARKFGSQCIVVAIDAKTVGPDRFEVFTHGGRRPTGIDAVAWARR